METTHALTLLTWIVPLGPMSLVSVLTVVGYQAAPGLKEELPATSALTPVTFLAHLTVHVVQFGDMRLSPDGQKRG